MTTTRSPSAAQDPAPRLVDLLANCGAAPEVVTALLNQVLREQGLENQRAYRLEWGGLISGLVVALSFLGASVGLITTGHSTSGTIVATTDVLALVGVFVYGRQRPRPPVP
jgi:hypothetical protein